MAVVFWMPKHYKSWNKSLTLRLRDAFMLLFMLYHNKSEIMWWLQKAKKL